MLTRYRSVAAAAASQLLRQLQQGLGDALRLGGALAATLERGGGTRSDKLTGGLRDRGRGRGNLTATAAAEAANYPFCTIDPNVGVVPVPDPRLQKIAEIVKPQKIIPTTIEFVDIAGIVKGASTGEGLGNKFLANIR